MKPILEVHGISKKYSRRADQHKSYAMRDLMSDIFRKKVSQSIRKDEFYAIQNVSFNLFPGESIGLIGRNGCGKSTTLRVCAGLIKPNAGKVVARGKIQALISLGAGFDKKLNGVDNIKNAAAILGLSPKETNSVLGEVIEFSELEEFIESPVSTYSSGMFARLGFSVAVHLRPDIIFIDEILGVGDFAFQNKCFIKMSQLQKRGVTVILVSHSHGRIVQMCEKAIWLKNGQIEKFGDSKETVEAYVDYLNDQETSKLREELGSAKEYNARSQIHEGLYGGEFDGKGVVESFDVSVTVNGEEFDRINIHDPMVVEYDLRLWHEPKRLKIGLVFYREDGERIAVTTSTENDAISNFNKKRFRCRIEMPDFCLRPGKYILVIPVQDGQSFLYRLPVKTFIVAGPLDRTLGIVEIPGNYIEI